MVSETLGNIVSINSSLLSFQPHGCCPYSILSRNSAVTDAYILYFFSKTRAKIHAFSCLSSLKLGLLLSQNFWHNLWFWTPLFPVNSHSFKDIWIYNSLCFTRDQIAVNNSNCLEPESTPELRNSSGKKLIKRIQTMPVFFFLSYTPSIFSLW